MIRTLDDTTFSSALHANDKPLLVDFSAPWCGPCKLQRPILTSFAEKHPELDVAEVDIDASPQTARALNVLSVPTLVVFRGGEPVAQVRGLQSAAKLEALLARD